MKLNLLLFLICLLEKVYLYKMEIWRPRRDASKRHRLYLNTIDVDEIEIPYNSLPNRNNMLRTQPLGNNCKQPNFRQCRTELTRRHFYPLYPPPGYPIAYAPALPPFDPFYPPYAPPPLPSYIHLKNSINGGHNTNTTTDTKVCSGQGSTCKGISFSTTDIINNYVRKRKRTSPKKCIARLAKRYIKCLTQSIR